jgi:DNA polymerase-3 subunit delta'
MGLSQVNGQPIPIQVLISALSQHRYANYLFSGPDGVGKRTSGLAFAQAINCPVEPGEGCGRCPSCQRIGRLTPPDIDLVIPLPPRLSEDEIAQLRSLYRWARVAPRPQINTSISIGAIRELKHRLSLYPARAGYRVVIILFADRFTEEAANAFLKILEEPPERTIFILTTSRLYKLAATIRSRCQLLRFNPLPGPVLAELVPSHIPEVDLDRLKLAIELAEGSVKTALQFLTAPDEGVRPEALELLSARPIDWSRLLDFINSLNPDAIEPFLNSLVMLFRQALYLKLELPRGPAQPVKALAQTLASRLSEEALLSALKSSLSALSDLASHPNPRLFLFDLLTSIISVKTQ